MPFRQYNAPVTGSLAAPLLSCLLVLSTCGAVNVFADVLTTTTGKAADTIRYDWLTGLRRATIFATGVIKIAHQFIGMVKQRPKASLYNKTSCSRLTSVRFDDKIFAVYWRVSSTLLFDISLPFLYSAPETVFCDSVNLNIICSYNNNNNNNNNNLWSFNYYLVRHLMPGPVQRPMSCLVKRHSFHCICGLWLSVYFTTTTTATTTTTTTTITTSITIITIICQFRWPWVTPDPVFKVTVV